MSHCAVSKFNTVDSLLGRLTPHHTEPDDFSLLNKPQNFKPRFFTSMFLTTWIKKMLKLKKKEEEKTICQPAENKTDLQEPVLVMKNTKTN